MYYIKPKSMHGSTEPTTGAIACTLDVADDMDMERCKTATANANAPRRAGGRPYRVLILRCSGMVVLHGDDLFTVPDSSSAPDTRPSPHDTAGA